MSNVTHDEPRDSATPADVAETGLEPPRAVLRPNFRRLNDRWERLIRSLPEELDRTAEQLDDVFTEYIGATERAGFEAGFAKAVLLAERGGGDSAKEDALAGRLRDVVNEAYLPKVSVLRVLLAVLQGVASRREDL
jgi:hypothetical protein